MLALTGKLNCLHTDLETLGSRPTHNKGLESQDCLLRSLHH